MMKLCNRDSTSARLTWEVALCLLILQQFLMRFAALRCAMTRYFGVLASDIHWTAEPERFFMEDVSYLACRVLGIRQVHTSPLIDVYINDSIYKNFHNMSVELPTPIPTFLMRARNTNSGTYEFDSYRAVELSLYAI